ncbi:MAG: toll/interleukin-1 receptor domain-containing protein [Acidobacteriota bacterium]
MSSPNYDVFLCYNSRDRVAVEPIARKLQEQGLEPWLDIWCLRPGIPWIKEIETQLPLIRAAIVFVGAEGIGPWQDHEIDSLLREFVRRGCPVIPTILPDCGQQPELPLFLRGMTWVDFRTDQPDPMSQLFWGITGEKAPAIEVDESTVVQSTLQSPQWTKFALGVVIALALLIVMYLSITISRSNEVPVALTDPGRVASDVIESKEQEPSVDRGMEKQVLDQDLDSKGISNVGDEAPNPLGESSNQTRSTQASEIIEDHVDDEPSLSNRSGDTQTSDVMKLVEREQTVDSDVFIGPDDIVIEIGPRDSLYVIAKKCYRGAGSIRRLSKYLCFLNRIENCDAVYAGQILVLPRYIEDVGAAIWERSEVCG